MDMDTYIHTHIYEIMFFGYQNVKISRKLEFKNFHENKASANLNVATV